MQKMIKGANVSLAALSEDVASVVMSLGWGSTTGEGDAGVSVLLLDDNGKVRSDADFCFYNNPVVGNGSVQLLGKTPTVDGNEERISFDLDAVPADVERIVVAGSRHGGSGFGDLDNLHLTLADSSGEGLLRFSVEDARAETAFIFGELYRRGGEWKFRAVGQGYESGLAGLAADFGVDIDIDDARDETPARTPDEGAGMDRGPQVASPAATVPSPRAPEPASAAPVSAGEARSQEKPAGQPGDTPSRPEDLAMAEAPTDTVDTGGDDDADREFVKHERDELRDFVKGLSPDDIKSGGWFTKLSAQALSSYTDKVDWQYFRERYEGVPADAVVDQRIKMAARYAALEGGLSAGAYSAAVAATLGSLGGASAATVPAAVATMMVDVAFIARLQLRLAYDVAVLYRVPLDLSDPDDMWKLIRVAFTIKSGEAVGGGVVKAVPAIVRPVIKRFYSKGVLNAARGLPVVGKYLLQRNVIKIGIPVVGVPLAVVLNRYTTLLAGRHAQAVFRNEARVIEIAEGLSKRSRHPQLMLWVAWLVIMADEKIADDEALLMRHLARLVRDQHQVVDKQLAHLVDFDPAEVWRRLDAEPGDLSDILDVADRVATVDGAVNAPEAAVISELRDRCSDRHAEVDGSAV
ncbi:TerD family protein [Streptomyces sp. SID8358]|uniref:TerD family protein n=1 Tax=Streptomyces sp. SID8358 TaxID=2690342 RepID=UPI000DB29BDA|nr:TerD family protein [Streptomyces sp. SID8358]